ncbi:MAG UNVERIFIED_CONTAM: hypothetical protein LVR18_26370 [Planctomycetaceae bacterium]
MSAETTDTDISRPYPFCLANPLPPDVAAELQTLTAADESPRLGGVGRWIVEWKWDGIRAQLIRRGGRTFVWSRGEELLEGRFPEIEAAATALPDGTVLDGEVLAWKTGQVLPFTELQKRINRRTVSRSLLAQVPVEFLAFDSAGRGRPGHSGAWYDRPPRASGVPDGWSAVNDGDPHGSCAALQRVAKLCGTVPVRSRPPRGRTDAETCRCGV